jgi:hypothetical protein
VPDERDLDAFDPELTLGGGKGQPSFGLTRRGRGPVEG